MTTFFRFGIRGLRPIYTPLARIALTCDDAPTFLMKMAGAYLIIPPKVVSRFVRKLRKWRLWHPANVALFAGWQAGKDPPSDSSPWAGLRRWVMLLLRVIFMWREDFWATTKTLILRLLAIRISYQHALLALGKQFWL